MTLIGLIFSMLEAGALRRNRDLTQPPKARRSGCNSDARIILSSACESGGGVSHGASPALRTKQTPFTASKWASCVHSFAP